jgi:hypothetical protein
MVLDGTAVSDAAAAVL